MYSNGRGVIKSNKRSKMNHLYIEMSYWSRKLGFMLYNRWGKNIFTFFSPPPTVLTMALPFSLTPHLPLTSVLHYADGKNGEKRAGKPRFPQERKKNDDERKERRQRSVSGFGRIFKVVSWEKMRSSGRNFCPWGIFQERQWLGQIF